MHSCSRGVLSGVFRIYLSELWVFSETQVQSSRQAHI